MRWDEREGKGEGKRNTRFRPARIGTLCRPTPGLAALAVFGLASSKLLGLLGINRFSFSFHVPA